jgi:hypothetical protein
MVLVANSVQTSDCYWTPAHVGGVKARLSSKKNVASNSFLRFFFCFDVVLYDD